MEKINSGFHMGDGTELWYVINDNGFDIYFGENAKKMCESMHSDGTEEPPKTIEDRLTDVEANIDYLMLLTDADSATEEETE